MTTPTPPPLAMVRASQVFGIFGHVLAGVVQAQSLRTLKALLVLAASVAVVLLVPGAVLVVLVAFCDWRLESPPWPRSVASVHRP